MRFGHLWFPDQGTHHCWMGHTCWQEMSVHNLRLAKMRFHMVCVHVVWVHKMWVHKMWLDHMGHGCLMSMKLSRHMVVSSSDLRMDDKPAVNSRVMDLLLVS